MAASNFAVSTMLNLARLKRYDGQIEQATNFINSFLDIQKNLLKDDSLAEIYCARSFVYDVYLHKYDDAIRDLDLVLEKKSYHSQALYRRFHMLQTHYKNYEEAIRDFDQLCTQEPSWNYGLVQWNFLVNNQSELTDTESKKLWEEHVYNKKPSKNNENTVSLPYTEGYFTESFFTENAQMMHALNEVIEQGSKDDQVFCYRGWIYLHQFQNYSRSLKDFIQAINLDSSYAFPFAWRGYCLLMMGNQNLALAKEDVKKAIQLDSSFADSFYILSLMLIREEKYEAAWKSLQKFNELLPKRSPKLDPKYVKDSEFQIGFLKTKIDISLQMELPALPRSPSSESVNVRNSLASSKSKSESFSAFRSLSRTADYPAPQRLNLDSASPPHSPKSRSVKVAPKTPETPATPPAIEQPSQNSRRYLSTRSNTLSVLDRQSIVPMSPLSTPTTHAIENSPETSALNLQSSSLGSSNIRRKTPRVVSQFFKASMSLMPSSGNVLTRPRIIRKEKSASLIDPRTSKVMDEEDNGTQEDSEPTKEISEPEAKNQPTLTAASPASTDPLTEELDPPKPSKPKGASIIAPSVSKTDAVPVQESPSKETNLPKEISKPVVQISQIPEKENIPKKDLPAFSVTLKPVSESSRSSPPVAAQLPEPQSSQKVLKFVKTPKPAPVIFTSADFNLQEWLGSIKMEFACEGLANLGAETISDLHHLTPDDLDMIPELKHLHKKRLYSEIQKLVKADTAAEESESDSQQNGNAGQPENLNPIFASETKNDWWNFPSSVLSHSAWSEKGEVNTKYRTLCLCEDSQIYHNHLYQQIRFLLYKKFGFGRTWDFSKSKWKLKKIYAVHNDSMSSIHESQVTKLARRIKEKPDLFNKKDWKSAAKVKVTNQIQGQLLLEKAEKFINTFPQNENCIARVIPLLHGVVDLTQAWSVCESGFASRLDESGKFGSGIYFSHQVGSILHNFEKRNSTEKQDYYVFTVCHVVVGNVFPCTQPTQTQVTGYDTHFAVVPRSDKEVQLDDLMKDTQSIFGEWVIFDEHQVLPQFVVVVEKD